MENTILYLLASQQTSPLKGHGLAIGLSHFSASIHEAVKQVSPFSLSKKTIYTY